MARPAGRRVRTHPGIARRTGKPDTQCARGWLGRRKVAGAAHGSEAVGSAGGQRLRRRSVDGKGVGVLVFRSFRGCSSAGRALQSHCRGQGFDPPQLHGVVQGRRVDRGRKDTLPLGVTGNTPDSGSGESWFEPRRGNEARQRLRCCRVSSIYPPAVVGTTTTRPPPSSVGCIQEVSLRCRSPR